MRLRRSDCTGPGLRRRRHGRGWVYLDAEGERVPDAEVLTRIRELAIPPAWKEVWICPYPGGHIQATGVDDRGRKQYLYHQRWRERQDQKKFDDMIEFARALPTLRARVDADLALGGFARDQVLACAARLLDRGLFRIGTEDYAVTNETYGLATMKREHVTIAGDALQFDYPAKHGKRHLRQVLDPDVVDLVRRLKARRGGNDELLAFKDGRRWVDVKSADINAYLKDATGLDVSAKDFRTWGATVFAAVALAASRSAGFSAAKRKRLITLAIKQVAHQLGNTPAVARASYIDPRVFDRFRDGVVIDADTVGAGEGTALQGAVEEAVLDLITGESVRRSAVLERAA
ncbi:MAG: topoisomerase [Solirubrobacteraceae bacterium]|nr:topoisomerase [Solirubrobacteraceae bacterium]